MMKLKLFSFTKWPLLAFTLLLAFSAPTSSRAQSIMLNSNETRVFEDFNWLPYAFFSGSFGLGFGAGGAYSGWHEEQTSLMGAIKLGANGVC